VCILMGTWTSVLIIKVSLLVWCTDFRGLNVCTPIQLGLWKVSMCNSSVLIELSSFSDSTC